MTRRRVHLYGSVLLPSTRSLSSAHYRKPLRPFPWQQHDWFLLLVLSISTNPLEVSLNCPVFFFSSSNCSVLKLEQAFTIIDGYLFIFLPNSKHFVWMFAVQVASAERSDLQTTITGTGGGVLKDTADLRPRPRCDTSPAAGRSPSSARWSFCPGRCLAATPSPTQRAPPPLCPDGLQAEEAGENDLVKTQSISVTTQEPAFGVNYNQEGIVNTENKRHEKLK